MAPNHARSRARRIQKNAVERPSPPKKLRLAAIADHDFRRELQSGEIFGDTLRPHAVRVDCEKLAFGKLKEVPGLATGRRARIQHSHPIANIQKRAGPLGARVLHRDLACSKTREPLDPTRLFEQDRILSERPRRHSGPVQFLQICFCGESPPVYPQNHGRMSVRLQKDGLPVARIGQAQLVDPPLRMSVMARFGRLDLREQLGHAALKVAHDRVDQPLRARVPEQDSRLHRLVHDRMRRVRPGGKLCERGEQQSPHWGIRERSLQEPLQGYVDHPVAPQRVIAKILRRGSKRLRRSAVFQVGERSVQALPSGDSPDGLRSGNKGLCKGWAGGNGGHGCTAQGHGRYLHYRRSTLDRTCYWASKRSPVVSGNPLRKSAARSRFPPDRCNSVMTRASSPHATHKPSGPMLSISPGFPRPAAVAQRQTLSSTPRTRASAPGDGLSARTWRFTVSAPLRQSTRASRFSSLAAYVTPSADCGVASITPACNASRACTMTFVPSSASRSRSVPMVSSSSIGISSCISTEPVSSPASICMIDTPVCRSPARSAR